MWQDTVTDKFAMDVVGVLVIRKFEFVRRLVGPPRKGVLVDASGRFPYVREAVLSPGSTRCLLAGGWQRP